MKKLLKNSQFALFLLLVATVIIFGIINPDILSAASLFALARLVQFRQFLLLLLW